MNFAFGRRKQSFVIIHKINSFSFAFKKWGATNRREVILWRVNIETIIK